jgi:2-C-methyl-D-erythritol 4-phosphate cytidylyltransferase/2-C-methyl-D-erythritol 2,4-cyclodiphosphate synthase
MNDAIAVIIVAGGKGARMESAVPKQYLELGGKTILRRSVDAFVQHADVDLIQIVIGEHDEKLCMRSTCGLNVLPALVGGHSRQESVMNGLDALQSHRPKYVLIHDAARPMVSKTVIDNVIAKLKTGAQAVIPGAQVVDTIKQVRGGIVSNTIDREQLIAVQTPQGFVFQTIYDLHQRAEGMEFSDDAGICEDFGVAVAVVAGEQSNLKITTVDDIIRAEALMEKM